RQPFQHTLSGGSVRQYLLQLTRNPFGREVLLYQLRNHLTLGNQVGHGVEGNFHHSLSESIGEVRNAVHHHEGRSDHSSFHRRRPGSDNCCTSLGQSRARIPGYGDFRRRLSHPPLLSHDVV